MGSIIAWLIAKGVSQKLARPLAYGGLILILLAAFSVAKCSYDRSVIEKHGAREEAKQSKRERKADDNLNQQKRQDEQAAEERKREIDDATSNLPDQAPSARQRSRACIELQRQAKAAGRNPPAC